MLSREELEKFDKDGYLVIKNFLSLAECAKLMNECGEMINKNNFVEEVKKQTVAINTDNTYFITSNDKIRPFLEKKAVEMIEQSKNTNEDVGDKIFNKIGHALHALNPVFEEVTFSDRVKDLFRSLKYENPIVCQSMYIFKQPFIGDEVHAHQDGSYLYVEPLKLAGIWIALEDGTLENGCLSFIPGSHKTHGLLTRFIRNPNKEEFAKGKFLMYTNETPKHDANAFVAEPVKAGDAILIHGTVIHKSEKNLSPKSRHVYTFHVYDRAKNAEWAKENWIEETKTAFVTLY